jgi:hypothetical protein
MSLAWYFRFVDRTNPLTLPGLVVLLCAVTFFALASTTDGGQVRDAIGERPFAGTLALFSLLPGYLLGMIGLQRRRTEQALVTLGKSVDVVSVRDRLERLHYLALPGVGLGIVYGALQNLRFIQEMYQEVSLNTMDVAFVCGNCFVWGTVALVLCWRVPVSIALSRTGAALELDIYRLDRLKPLARVATTDILVVAGAMAFMPLQSLDAEFRMGNYDVGMLVGVPAAIVLFIVPLWGLHRNIKQSKAERLQTLRERLDEVDRQDVAELETLTSHIDRVRSIPNWPVDLQTVTRVFGYVIIPPVAWVGAALVENLVNS